MNNRFAIVVLAMYLAATAVAAYIATIGKFGGIYLVALTLPWSLISVFILDVIDPKFLDNMAWGIGISFIGVVANGFIIFRLCSRRGVKARSKHLA